MPFTYLSHQAPVLPIKDRWPDRWDGLALVVGSMAPDLTYVTIGWGYGPGGRPMWFDGHSGSAQLTLMVFSMALAWLIRLVVMPVLPRCAPDGGELHLHDYRWVATGRPAVWVTAYSALVGAFTHLFLDAFTHPDGAVVTSVSAMQTSLLTIGGKHLTVFKLLQYGGTLVGAAISLAYLLRIGRDRRVLAWCGRTVADADAADTPVPTAARAIAGGSIAVGVVLGTTYAVHRSGGQVVGANHIPANVSVPIIGFTWVVFLAAAVGCVIARPFLGHDRRPAPGDPAPAPRRD